LAKNKERIEMNVDLQGIGMTSQRTRSRLITMLREMGITSEDVLSVIMNTPRHIFVDEALASRAYENTALPIGYNQTISQPYIVARMVEVLLAAGDIKKVLEVGTGCGYQTAILAQQVDHVYSIERIDALLKKHVKNYAY
jgi:protein-L-isoaspartate(D-aspartate) O-methyltransferase